jgi:hypothetical protein
MSDSIGIPYAFHAKLSDGTVDPNRVVCPECGEICGATTRGSTKSAHAAYAKHYAAKHAPTTKARKTP